jgi:hypothetical protein
MDVVGLVVRADFSSAGREMTAGLQDAHTAVSVLLVRIAYRFAEIHDSQRDDVDAQASVGDSGLC